MTQSVSSIPDDRQEPPEQDVPATDSESWGGLETLPGHPLIWILILSELVVFGAFLLGFSGARVKDPTGFAISQMQLDRVVGGINTMVLLTSGLCAVFATRAIRLGNVGHCRGWLLLTALLGVVFLGVKIVEYKAKIDAGISMETNSFFTLYFLITGFHALHVVMGLGILGIVALRPLAVNIETGVAFWHMIDLIWVLVFPVVYLVR